MEGNGVKVCVCVCPLSCDQPPEVAPNEACCDHKAVLVFVSHFRMCQQILHIDYLHLPKNYTSGDVSVSNRSHGE